MNTVKNCTALLVVMLLSAAVSAQTIATVKLRGTRLTYPLVNKWIEEFRKEYPQINVTISPSSPADSIDFSIASYPLTENDLNENQSAIVVSQYAQLLIANGNRPGLVELQNRGITEQDFGNLFFQHTPDLLALSSAESSVLFIRDRPVCAVKAFARHYGNNPIVIKGTGIKGDDQDLIVSVKNNIHGVAFNNLGFIFDLETRKVNSGLAVIPLDLNKNGKVDSDEQVYDSLDQVIAYIEKRKSKAFVIAPVNFVFDKNSQNQSAAIFLNWILVKGQKYNHALGFLNLEEQQLKEQRNALAVLRPVSTPSCESTNALMKERRIKAQSNP